MSVRDYARISKMRFFENLTDSNTSKNQESFIIGSLDQTSLKVPEANNGELVTVQTTRTGQDSKVAVGRSNVRVQETHVFSARTQQRENKFDTQSKKMRQLDKIHYSVDGLTDYSMDGFDTNRDCSNGADISFSLNPSDKNRYMQIQ